eukprot:6175814-Pleurochrysis_carterae.AAC.4
MRLPSISCINPWKLSSPNGRNTWSLQNDARSIYHETVRCHAQTRLAHFCATREDVPCVRLPSAPATHAVTRRLRACAAHLSTCVMTSLRTSPAMPAAQSEVPAVALCTTPPCAFSLKARPTHSLSRLPPRRVKMGKATSLTRASLNQLSSKTISSHSAVSSSMCSTNSTCGGSMWSPLHNASVLSARGTYAYATSSCTARTTASVASVGATPSPLSTTATFSAGRWRSTERSVSPISVADAWHGITAPMRRRKLR